MQIHALAQRFYADASWPYQLARYASIGGFVTCIDVGTFALFLRAGWPLLAVITASWAIALATHFSLNKYVNFRAHDRPAHEQAGTYAVIAGITWLTTTAIVKIAIAFGATPLVGKAIAIAFNVPIGFFGHRHLTFGRGITATARLLLKRR
ncbi:MAG TPA: GtrA family protein [Candidatus Baltobacteraceae bacterium]|nr:GtrA family protein [Candidatus Baltobacteraceae bacterium]